MKICLGENKKFQSIAKIQNQHYFSYESDKNIVWNKTVMWLGGVLYGVK